MIPRRRGAPIIGITASDSDKDDKPRANHNFWRLLRHALRLNGR